MKSMRKILLTAAAVLLAATSAWAENVETTAYKYDFSTYDSFTLPENCFKKGQPSTWADFGVEDLSQGQIATHVGPSSAITFDDLKDGFSIVDLGNTYGKFLCINGYGSGFTEFSKNINSSIESIGAFTNIAAWFNIWFYLPDIKETSYKGQKLRLKIQYAVYRNDDFLAHNNDFPNATTLRGASLGAVAANIPNFSFKPHANEIGKLEKWVEYTADINELTNETGYSLNLTIQPGNFMSGKTLLIRSIELCTIDEVEYTEGKSIEFPFDFTIDIDEANSTVKGVKDLPESAKYYYALGWFEPTEAGLDGISDDGLEYKAVEGSSLFNTNDDGNYVLNYVSEELTESEPASISEEESEDTVPSKSPVLFLKVVGGVSKDIVLGTYKTEINTTQQIMNVKDVAVNENAAGQVVYFNLSGVRVNGENLPAGLYIRREGNKVSKVIVK